jgi:ribonuclease HI
VAKIKTVLTTLPPIKFYFVKAHNGDALNERADALAVEAVKTRSTHKRKVLT